MFSLSVGRNKKQVKTESRSMNHNSWIQCLNLHSYNLAITRKCIQPVGVTRSEPPFKSIYWTEQTFKEQSLAAMCNGTQSKFWKVISRLHYSTLKKKIALSLTVNTGSPAKVFIFFILWKWIFTHNAFKNMKCFE